MKVVTTVKKGRHYGLPIETVLDYCNQLHDEGLAVDTTVYKMKDGVPTTIDTKRSGVFKSERFDVDYSDQCPCSNDECPGKTGDWVWIDTNLQPHSAVRDVLKAIGFEFTGKNATHPEVWANSCQKPVRYKRKGKGKGKGKATTTTTPPRKKSTSDFMQRLQQQRRNQAS